MSPKVVVVAMFPYKYKLDPADEIGYLKIIESHIRRLSLSPQFRGIFAERRR